MTTERQAYLMVFSFDDPQFEEFLADWARTLLTYEPATAVYYIGTSVWMPSDVERFGGLQVVPNFIVRTDDPKWEVYSGFPHGIANHKIVNLIDDEVLHQFFARWHETGWTEQPSKGNLFLIPQEPMSFIRVIEVPASANWAGPEYLGRIHYGVSVERIFQESLRRYDEALGRFGAVEHYLSKNESRVKR